MELVNLLVRAILGLWMATSLFAPVWFAILVPDDLIHSYSSQDDIDYSSLYGTDGTWMGCGVEESFYYGFNDYIGSKIEYTAWDVDDAAPEGRGFCVGGRIEDKDGEYRHIVMYYSYPVDLSFH